MVSPSSAEHTAAAAFPPADPLTSDQHRYAQDRYVRAKKRTFGDFVYYGARTLLTDVVHNDVRAKAGVHECVDASETLT